MATKTTKASQSMPCDNMIKVSDWLALFVLAHGTEPYIQVSRYRSNTTMDAKLKGCESTHPQISGKRCWEKIHL